MPYRRHGRIGRDKYRNQDLEAGHYTILQQVVGRTGTCSGNSRQATRVHQLGAIGSVAFMMMVPCLDGLNSVVCLAAITR